VRDVCKFASIFTLALLSVDRCLASYHHLGALRTIGLGKIAICVIWIACAVIGTPYLTYAGIRSPSAARNVTSCQLAWPQQVGSVWTAFQFLVGFVIPSAIILAAYAILFRRLRRIRRRRSGRAAGVMTKPSRRMLHTVLVVVVAFVVCQTPYCMKLTLPLICDQQYIADPKSDQRLKWRPSRFQASQSLGAETNRGHSRTHD